MEDRFHVVAVGVECKSGIVSRVVVTFTGRPIVPAARSERRAVEGVDSRPIRRLERQMHSRERAIGAVGRYLVEETDEYQRALLIRAVLWATGAALAAATVRDFLVDYAHVQPMEDGFAFFVFCIALGIAQVVIRLRERA